MPGGRLCDIDGKRTRQSRGSLTPRWSRRRSVIVSAAAHRQRYTGGYQPGLLPRVPQHPSIHEVIAAPRRPGGEDAQAIASC